MSISVVFDATVSVNSFQFNGKYASVSIENFSNAIVDGGAAKIGSNSVSFVSAG